ncbi:MAG TPA: prepilin-type N-terminal cleavage/methylation domain-containing protein [Sedimentisphaerales bacterium]|nr:prepilin-type N-terminal cleavage/methylation domain-containing protein [Sedimentisphaerales bacterium]
MNRYRNIAKRKKRPAGLSLVEMVISVMIGGMVLVAVYTVYIHALRNVAAVSAAIERDELPDRILKLLARDLDRFFVNTEDVSFVLQPMHEGGLVSARLIMESRIYDNRMHPRPHERIVWEARYDPLSESLILYRGHSGIVSEDRLLHRHRTEEERRQLVPLCDGLTHFEINAFVEGSPRNAFAGNVPPNQVVVSLSFAPPELRGDQYVIPEDSIITRTIAVNRLRKIPYIFTEPVVAELEDANDAADPNNQEIPQ